MINVVITGCGGRLGQKFIEAYGDRYNIYGVSSKPKNSSLNYHHISTNLSRYNEIIDSIDEIDCWINNAYAYNMISPKQYSHGFLQELHVGVVIPYEASCYLYNKWAKQKDWTRNKSILNISSIAAVNFYDVSQTTYASCKSAMNRMTTDLAKTFAGKVRVNAICPNSFPYYVSYEALFRSMCRLIEGNETGILEILDAK